MFFADDPKPPGLVELDQNIPGTVTLCWTPSPDEKRDDRLHYMVSKRDSFKPTWRTVADNLFNNKFTVVNIMPGREYYFRVFAKNDMGLSAPAESPVFAIKKEKGLCQLQFSFSTKSFTEKLIKLLHHNRIKLALKQVILCSSFNLPAAAEDIHP